MTNPIKAPRLCTLWGQTFDSNNVIRIGVYDELGYCVGIGIKKPNGSKYHFTYYFDSEAQALLKMLEAIQAIASAQRPWLKAEGFEFVEGEVYWVKHNLDRTFILCKHENGEFTPCWSDGTFIRERYAIPSFLARHILAFKLIDDSPEAWDKLAGVEVYKEGE